MAPHVRIVENDYYIENTKTESKNDELIDAHNENQQIIDYISSSVMAAYFCDCFLIDYNNYVNSIKISDDLLRKYNKKINDYIINPELNHKCKSSYTKDVDSVNGNDYDTFIDECDNCACLNCCAKMNEYYNKIHKFYTARLDTTIERIYNFYTLHGDVMFIKLTNDETRYCEYMLKRYLDMFGYLTV